MIRREKAVRYERKAPGDLVHVDIKKLGNIPDGGGWRIHGRPLGGRTATFITTRVGRAKSAAARSWGTSTSTTTLMTTHGWPTSRSTPMRRAARLRPASDTEPCSGSPSKASSSTASWPTTAPATARRSGPTRCARTAARRAALRMKPHSSLEHGACSRGCTADRRLSRSRPRPVAIRCAICWPSGTQAAWTVDSCPRLSGRNDQRSPWQLRS